MFFPITDVLKNFFQGAQTSLHCCLADNLKNGEFYSGIVWKQSSQNTIDVQDQWTGVSCQLFFFTVNQRKSGEEGEKAICIECYQTIE